MTVHRMRTALNLEVLCESTPTRPVCGGYTGDLLSWVMGNAKSADAWVTIMTNVNIIAVANLADVACVVVAENAQIDPDVVALAKERSVNLYRSSLASFELCCRIGQML